ncbi:MAG: SWIM zinc finger family protein [Planctomycetota bacterium]|nr:SWIM zinc finger family protein [Planctomycetota bacterium]
MRTGIKLRAREDVTTTTPIAERWRRLIEDAVPRAELSEGLRYARLGQTTSLAVEDGALRATVQGSRVKPHETGIGIGQFSSLQWDRIVEAMAGEAVYLVKLLDGELPEGLDTLLGALGLSLLPEDAAELDIKCSCRVKGPCRHAAAIGYLFTEQLSADPLLILTLRGMPASRLLERLRQARTIQARGVAAAHADPMIPQRAEDAPPLEACVEEFWRPPPGARGQSAPPPPQHVSHALLRRLGPPPLDGRFPLVGLLASIYDSVARHAVHLRDQAERLEEGRETPADESE